MLCYISLEVEEEYAACQNYILKTKTNVKYICSLFYLELISNIFDKNNIVNIKSRTVCTINYY